MDVSIFMEEMLRHHSDELAGKSCVISGSGNVAQYAALKLINLGAKVIVLSDSTGFVHDPNGIDEEKLNFIINLKTVKRQSLAEFAREWKLDFHVDEKPWTCSLPISFPVCDTK